MAGIFLGGTLPGAIGSNGQLVLRRMKMPMELRIGYERSSTHTALDTEFGNGITILKYMIGTFKTFVAVTSSS
jgi:hypothetical protein